MKSKDGEVKLSLFGGGRGLKEAPSEDGVSTVSNNEIKFQFIFLSQMDT